MLNEARGQRRVSDQQTRPLPELCERLRFIDVEASGFGAGSYPIEIGISGPGSVLNCFLIRPLPEWQHWDPAAERLHGISQQVLQTHGRDPGKVADRLNHLLAGEVVYTDAWGQDMAWLARLMEETERPMRFRVESVLTLLDEAELERWDAVKGAVMDKVQASRHRASTDARILRLTFKTLRTVPDICADGQGP